jgi:hypothetical protein
MRALNIAHQTCSRQAEKWTRVAHKKRLSSAEKWTSVSPCCTDLYNLPTFARWGLADTARHVIQRMFNPRLLSKLAPSDADLASSHVIQPIFKPRLLSKLTPCDADVASSIRLALRRGSARRARPVWCLELVVPWGCG